MTGSWVFPVIWLGGFVVGWAFEYHRQARKRSKAKERARKLFEPLLNEKPLNNLSQDTRRGTAMIQGNFRHITMKDIQTDAEYLIEGEVDKLIIDNTEIPVKKPK